MQGVDYVTNKTLNQIFSHSLSVGESSRPLFFIETIEELAEKEKEGGMMIEAHQTDLPYLLFLGIWASSFITSTLSPSACLTSDFRSPLLLLLLLGDREYIGRKEEERRVRERGFSILLPSLPPSSLDILPPILLSFAELPSSPSTFLSHIAFSSRLVLYGGRKFTKGRYRACTRIARGEIWNSFPKDFSYV